MVLDKFVITSILNLDEYAIKFAEAIEEAEKNYISAVNYFEVAAYVENKFGDLGARELDNFFKKADIQIHDVNEKIVEFAREAHRFYGKTKNPEVALSLSDCFAYGLAKYLNEPLLFKGDHFKKTDIIAAL